MYLSMIKYVLCPAAHLDLLEAHQSLNSEMWGIIDYIVV